VESEVSFDAWMYICRNEALIREVEQLKQVLEGEGERFRALHEQSQLIQNELMTVRVSSEDGAKNLVLSLAENNELKAEQARMQRELQDEKGQAAKLLADLEQSRTQIEKLDGKEGGLRRQLSELTTALTSTSTEVQSKAAAIALLESQLMQVREEKSMLITRHAEEAQKQFVQMDQLKLVAQQKEVLEAELQQTKGQVEELRNTISSKTEEACAVFKQLNERLSLARQEVDKRVEELEMLRKQRGKMEEEFRCDIERYERDLEEGIQSRSTLQHELTELKAEKEGVQLEKEALMERLHKTEVILAETNERMASLEFQASDIQVLQAENAELKKRQGQCTSSGAEIALRIELDRVSRTLMKERKLFELQMSEMRDQVVQHQASSNFDEIERLRSEKAELERLLLKERTKNHELPQIMSKSGMAIPRDATPLKTSQHAPTPEQKSPENVKPGNMKTPAAVNECKQQ
jgi:myosin heavy subunit